MTIFRSSDMKILLKTYLAIMFVIVCWVLWRVIAPALLSSHSSSGFWLGVVLLAVSVPTAIYFAIRFIHSFNPTQKET